MRSGRSKINASDLPTGRSRSAASIYQDDKNERLLNDWKHHINLLGCGYDHPVSAHAAYQTLLRKRHDEAVRDTPQDPDYDPDDTFPQSYRYEYRLRRKCG